LPADGTGKLPKKYGIEIKYSVDFAIADFRIAALKFDPKR
jgi:hypothetical protein